MRGAYLDNMVVIQCILTFASNDAIEVDAPSPRRAMTLRWALWCQVEHVGTDEAICECVPLRINGGQPRRDLAGQPGARRDRRLYGRQLHRTLACAYPPLAGWPADTQGPVIALVAVAGFASTFLHKYVAVMCVDQTLVKLPAVSASDDVLRSIENELRPMFAALPKNSLGKLEAAIVRYAPHRFYVQRQGWYTKGLEPNEAA